MLEYFAKSYQLAQGTWQHQGYKHFLRYLRAQDPQATEQLAVALQRALSGEIGDFVAWMAGWADQLCPIIPSSIQLTRSKQLSRRAVLPPSLESCL